MLEIKNLTKLFSSGDGISNISFSIKPGDIVGMVGDNGAGKSTIIKTLFNEYGKNSGEFYLDNLPLNKKDYKKMAFFPDQSIFPNNISIEKYCTYSGCLSGISKKTILLRTRELLKYLKLYEYKNKTFKHLSAGMQKRAMLAITLISDPEIIVLDEPTSNLDLSSRFEFLELLKKLAGSNKTILITSHIINELQGLINKLIIIKEGTLIYEKYLEENEMILSIYNNKTKSNEVNKDRNNLADIFSK
ncbi:ABC transporter ATP-binding protein [Spiroplasma chinense]|uniref:ABC transporter ATP-binding protein n=1 Tax=Spiroplasma chinense TaxID=216932 RepID=A0A5B9Y4F9_9MOLU|nr:ABC transporter ATP-binding protein [Spiroplasma chinense]QEH61569.1 ABC transporter ATP-binding protein [Spiroplasma chinense]